MWLAFNFSVRIPLFVAFNVTTSDVPKSIRCHSRPRMTFLVKVRGAEAVDRAVHQAQGWEDQGHQD